MRSESSFDKKMGLGRGGRAAMTVFFILCLGSALWPAFEAAVTVVVVVMVLAVVLVTVGRVVLTWLG